MKKLVLLFILMYPMLLLSTHFDSQRILELAESGNEKQISNEFDQIPSLSISQGNFFLNN